MKIFPKAFVKGSELSEHFITQQRVLAVHDVGLAGAFGLPALVLPERVLGAGDVLQFPHVGGQRVRLLALEEQ